MFLLIEIYPSQRVTPLHKSASPSSVESRGQNWISALLQTATCSDLPVILVGNSNWMVLLSSHLETPPGTSGHQCFGIPTVRCRSPCVGHALLASLPSATAWQRGAPLWMPTSLPGLVPWMWRQPPDGIVAVTAPGCLVSFKVETACPVENRMPCINGGLCSFYW